MTFIEYMERIRIFAFVIIVRLFAFAGAYSLLARLFIRYVKEINDGVMSPVEFGLKHEDKLTILVLDYPRFRGDVDLFSKSSDVRFLSISWSLLRYLLAAFVYEPTHKEQRSTPAGHSYRFDFASAPDGSQIHTERRRYRSFLKRFLPIFLDGLGVRVVMNSDFRYRREADLTRVASELGYVHICYYREAMYNVKANYDFAVVRHRIFAPFHGRKIAVQNEITRQMFIESGITEPEKIIIRGCPRMDDFLQNLGQPVTRRNQRRQIAYFSYPKGVQLVDGSTVDLFESAMDVVRALAEFARDEPDIHVVLKMKDMHFKGQGNGQISELEDIIRNVAAGETLPSIEFVTDRMGAHDVIAQSDIVCAMQSTIVLEAAIAGKPVILPHFKSLRERQHADQFLMYQEYRDLFDVPDTPADLKSILRDRLANPDIEPSIMKRRRELFEEYVSPLSADATDFSLKLIRDLASDGRQQSS